MCSNNNLEKVTNLRERVGGMGRFGGGRGRHGNNVDRMLFYDVFRKIKISLKMQKLNSGNK